MLENVAQIKSNTPSLYLNTYIAKPYNYKSILFSSFQPLNKRFINGIFKL